ncbi:MAG: hypothetical protein SPJ83_03595 [Helicobacter sp.]|uniref:hypothetical protein n=1 Tax=Helicobacter sp. TaxID=218 RepID=UPI002A914E3E|nr:hypothetical protein [Helicobacter sp.]MDY5821870.1 hypothetical protein [Helicobacter sp.]
MKKVCRTLITEEETRQEVKKDLLGDNTLQIMITLSISKTILPPSRNVSNLLLL